MNKQDLVYSVSRRTGIKPEDVHEIISEMLDVIVAEVATGGNVAISNFGTFRAVDNKARKARNPQNGEMINLPRIRRLRFRVSPRTAELVKLRKARIAGVPVSVRKLPKGSITNVSSQQVEE